MAFSAFFSGMEMAFVSGNRMWAEMGRTKDGLSQRAIAFFYRNSNNFVSTTNAHSLKSTLLNQSTSTIPLWVLKNAAAIMTRRLRFITLAQLFFH